MKHFKLNTPHFVVAFIFTCATLACSGEESDPIAEQCQKSCELPETSPCIKEKSKCLADCKQLAASVLANPQYVSGCADCVAKSFTYDVKTVPPCSASSSDPTCCYDIKHVASPEGPECEKQCLEPDES